MNDYEKIGVVGLCVSAVIALFIFIKGLMKDHRSERDEWRKVQEKRDEEHNKSLNRNTEVLSELTTLIKTMKS